MPTQGAIRDARAFAREANERAATYRSALLEVRQLLPRDSPGVRLINEALAPTAEPRVLLAAHVEHPPLRIHDRRHPECALDASNEPRTVPLFVARMAGAEPCPRCSAAAAAPALLEAARA
ncbi:MAG: hypothetical protein AB7G21_09950 [Dehalococcoidia bacterium]